MAGDSADESGVGRSGAAKHGGSRGTTGAFRAGIVLAALALLVSLWRIDGVLGALHQPGAASYRIGDLSGATSLAWDTDRPAKVLATWGNAPWQPKSDTSPTAVATWYLGLDAVFIAVYATLLRAAVRSQCRRVRLIAGNKKIIDAIAARRLKRGRAGGPATEHDVEAGLLRTYLDAGRWVLGAVVAAAITDLAEDLLQLLMVQWHVDGPLAYVLLYAATIAKWALLVGVLAYLAVTTYSVLQHMVRPGERTELGNLIAAAGVLRAQIVVVLAWTGGIFFAEQTPDVLRRWLDASSDGAALGAAASGIVATLVLCLAVLTSGRLMLRQWRKAWDHAVSPRWSLVAGVVIGALALLLYLTGHGGQPLIVPAALALAVPIGDRLLPSVRSDSAGVVPERRDGWTTSLVEVVAIAPLAALALGLLHASVADAVFTRELRYRFLVAGGIALLVVTAALWAARGRLVFERRDGTVLAGCCAGALAVALWIELDHWPTAEWVGTIGIVALFAILVSGLAYLGTWIAERVRPPRIVLVLRLRRIPVFALIVLWAVLATRLGDGAYHDVRTVDRAHDSVTVDGAFSAWLSANGINPHDSTFAGGSDSTTRPLVLVAAEGGGIRAAYWTALAMDCMFSDGRGGEKTTGCPTNGPGTEPVFAASGASGGSVGLAAYMAHQFEHPDDTGWVRERLGGDYVSPTVSQALFADLPDAFLGIHGFWDDRAATLERSWEREWPGDQMTQLSPSRIWDGGRDPATAGPHRFPLLLLNGTSVADGCRINVSVLNAAVGRRAEGEPAVPPNACSSLVPFEPPAAGGARTDWTLAGTKDLTDFLCPNEDVRLSTAALLSARFPYVTPYGRLSPCQAGGPRTSYDVDGGYLDNTGVTPLLQVWQTLEPLVRAYNAQPGTPCLVPLFVQLDNHYVAPAGPDEAARPTQLAAPPLTVKTSRDGEEANARQEAALAFGRVVWHDAEHSAPGYAHIYPRTHPGSQAPLGWTLSTGSMDDLDRQMRSENRAAIEALEHWFGGGLDPAGPAGSGSSWCRSEAAP